MRPSTIPADLATLAWAAPGQELEIRRLFGRARSWLRVFAPGDRVVCRDVDVSGVIVCTAARTHVRIPWDCARAIQVERIGFGSGAQTGLMRPAGRVRLLTPGPVQALLLRGPRTARPAAVPVRPNHERERASRLEPPVGANHD